MPPKTSEKELDLPKDPAVCEFAAIDLLSNIVRDTDLHKEIDFNRLKASFMNGLATADVVFDTVAKHAKDEDVKKDVLMYKKWAKCDYSEHTK